MPCPVHYTFNCPKLRPVLCVHSLAGDTIAMSSALSIQLAKASSRPVCTFSSRRYHCHVQYIVRVVSLTGRSENSVCFCIINYSHPHVVLASVYPLFCLSHRYILCFASRIGISFVLPLASVYPPNWPKRRLAHWPCQNFNLFLHN